MSEVHVILRLLVAAACGLAIGAERQYRSRTAGLRTNALVAAGAAMFVSVGLLASPADALQITAYVVSGVGFLGGGVILRQGYSVQGLNTAATLWCSAAIGCEAAAGHWLLALAATAVVLGVHIVMRPLGHLLDRDPSAKSDEVNPYELRVVAARKREPAVRAHVLHVLGQSNAVVRGVSCEGTGESDAGSKNHPDMVLAFDLLLEGDPHGTLDGLVSTLCLDAGVHSVSWSREGSDEDSDDLDEGSSRGNLVLRRRPRR